MAPVAERPTGTSLPSAYPARPSAPTLSLRVTAPSSNRTVGACTAEAEAHARRSLLSGAVYGSAAADELR